ncbi:hypothetical protein TREMEDRAFT_63696 [Tremella mesenterica DSM 1558]|uniref:uncharacterized protein n=1 Tax=Tremella mesenterica (strain ATCC 24925 / CBS 8224 / DSM 1558 / NBRC 9311 / NRRL Y-6157 / RJB 2259-6 / UBC 559-6) TaxID=578456 RepID=UPI0003F49DFF|nr:uncharacterized protein TREMEDRAFT_63696 [Tremella mesenterica DSM 1558]EIW67805.1 hypothetical protein TREMEDRAFT_63696 [Tremella mesenterica DSM 1558]
MTSATSSPHNDFYNDGGLRRMSYAPRQRQRLDLSLTEEAVLEQLITVFQSVIDPPEYGASGSSYPTYHIALISLTKAAKARYESIKATVPAVPMETASPETIKRNLQVLRQSCVMLQCSRDYEAKQTRMEALVALVRGRRRPENTYQEVDEGQDLMDAFMAGDFLTVQHGRSQLTGAYIVSTLAKLWKEVETPKNVFQEYTKASLEDVAKTVLGLGGSEQMPVNAYRASA